MGLVGRNDFSFVGNIQTAHKQLPCCKNVLVGVYSVTVRVAFKNQTHVVCAVVNMVEIESWLKAGRF